MEIKAKRQLRLYAGCAIGIIRLWRARTTSASDGLNNVVRFVPFVVNGIFSSTE
jgi:hypothetical protein